MWEFIKLLYDLWREDKPYTTCTIILPTELLNGAKTMAHIQNMNSDEDEDGTITKDHIISWALHDYINKNLWTTKEDGNVTKIGRVKVRQSRDEDTGKYVRGSGRRQSR